jgi:hypothetical protein
MDAAAAGARRRSWADTVSDHGEGEDAPDVAEVDVCDALLCHFPVPGEIWVRPHFRAPPPRTLCVPVAPSHRRYHPPQPGPKVRNHLRSTGNYLSALLALYPPASRPTPFVAAAPVHEYGSPYRIQHGNTNPGLAGVVVTADRVIPSLGHAPRLAIDPDALAAALGHPAPDDLLVLPAVHGALVRLFHADAEWYVADDARVERIPTDGAAAPAPSAASLTQQLHVCLRAHGRCRRPALVVPRFLQDLKRDRVWFFALYPERGTLVAVGTCRAPTHAELTFDPHFTPNLDFSVHAHIAPSVPIIPTQHPTTGAGGLAGDGPLHDAAGPVYTGLYEGILLLNVHTLFGVRLCSPEVVYLTPLLQRRRSLAEFLAHRTVESRLADHNQGVDGHTHHWLTVTVPEYTHRLFGADDAGAALVDRIGEWVDTLYHWIGSWMWYTAALPPADWAALDLRLQRLFILLFYVFLFVNYPIDMAPGGSYLNIFFC